MQDIKNRERREKEERKELCERDLKRKEKRDRQRFPEIENIKLHTIKL